MLLIDLWRREMAPKFKFNKEEIINSAIDIIREDGTENLTARAIAKKIGSSTKPIFTLFSGMEELNKECLVKANDIYQAFLKKEMESGEFPPYKASGLAYIKFAIEEKELFKLLFMRDRTKEYKVEDLEPIRELIELIMKNLNIDEDTAFLFHMESWIFVHGIATMFATDYLDWDMNMIQNMLSDMYRGLVYQHTGRQQ